MKDIGSRIVQERGVVGSKRAKAAQVHIVKELVDQAKLFGRLVCKQLPSILFFPFSFLNCGWRLLITMLCLSKKTGNGARDASNKEKSPCRGAEMMLLQLAEIRHRRNGMWMRV